MLNNNWTTALNGISATVKAIYHAKQFLDSTFNIPAGASFGIVLDKTCFYAEAGGQEYDTGSITLDVKGREAKFEVIDCQSFKGYIVHIGHLDDGQINVGDAAIATYDQVFFFFWNPTMHYSWDFRIAEDLSEATIQLLIFSILRS